MRMRTLRSALLGILVSTLCAACGDDDTSAAIDGGSGDGANAGFMPAPPVIPWWDDDAGTGMPPIAPPVLRPCPAGWREATTDTGVDYCDPWPESGAATCPDGQAHFAGEPGCTTVGAPCPAGDFPADIPAGVPVRYVRAGAAGGDGSEARPFGTIGEALAGAASGTAIAIGKGRYDEIVRPPAGVTLIGACAAETILTQTAGVEPGTPAAVLYVTAPGVVARNLQVADARLIGVRVESPGTLEIDGVVVSHVQALGLRVYPSASAVARDLVVRGTIPRDRDSAGGGGIGVEVGATLDLTRAIVEDNLIAGIGVLGGTLRARDVAVRQVAPDSTTLLGGYGIDGEAESTLELERIVIEDTRFGALVTRGVGATLTATDVVVRRTLPQMSDGKGGFAVGAMARATGTVSRLFAGASVDMALYAIEATLDVSDAVVVDVDAAAGMETSGHALFATFGATATVRRGVFVRARSAALFAQEASNVLLEDVRLVDVRASESDPIPSASAVVSVAGADVTWRRGAVTGAIGPVAYSVGAPSRVGLEDVLIGETRSNPAAIGVGVGLAAFEGGRADATRAVVTGTQGIGALADVGSTMQLADTIVRDGRPATDLLQLGRGIMIQRGSMGMLDRVRIIHHRELALAAIEDAAIAATDLAVIDTRRRECASSTCGDTAGGTAVASIARSSVVIEGFVVDGAELCGIQIATDSSADLRRGEVRNAAIGACVQVPGYDLARLSSDVAYRDNGAGLQASTLPVPEVTEIGAVPGSRP